MNQKEDSIAKSIERRYNDIEKAKILGIANVYFSEDERERLRLFALNGMMHYWVQAIRKEKRIKKLSMELEIPTAVLTQFVKGNLDLGSRAADRLHEYLKENNMMFEIKLKHGDYDYDNLIEEKPKRKRRKKIEKNSDESGEADGGEETDINKGN